MTSPTRQDAPRLRPDAQELQSFEELRPLPIGLADDVRSEHAEGLNRILANTRILHDLYKKTHWTMRGPTFYQLHLLMDEHAKAQYALIDEIAERIQQLGAIAVGDPRHVAELTSIERPHDGAEDIPSALTRLLDAHEQIVTASRELADKAGEAKDTTTEDLLSSRVTPTNELQIWFVAEHLVEVPLVGDWSTGAFTATASASVVDPVLLDDGAELSFGNNWSGGAASAAGNLRWNDAGGLTTGRVTDGNLYIENSSVHARVQLEYYAAAGHTGDPIATREGGEKIGTGAFLNTFPITVGGVNCDCTHIHVNLQKLVNGTWTTVDTEIEDL